jgi:hypothetical protein
LSGGPVLGYARVSRVEEYDNLTPSLIVDLTTMYRQELALSEYFLARKLESKFASLLFLAEVTASEPWSYKQDGRSGWIVLNPADARKFARQFATMPLASFNNQEDAAGSVPTGNNLRKTGL